jgi:hypothetical protein
VARATGAPVAAERLLFEEFLALELLALAIELQAGLRPVERAGKGWWAATGCSERDENEGRDALKCCSSHGSLLGSRVARTMSAHRWQASGLYGV